MSFWIKAQAVKHIKAVNGQTAVIQTANKTAFLSTVQKTTASQQTKKHDRLCISYCRNAYLKGIPMTVT
jgi:hypothetical protein